LKNEDLSASLLRATSQHDPFRLKLSTSGLSPATAAPPALPFSAPLGSQSSATPSLDPPQAQVQTSFLSLQSSLAPESSPPPTLEKEEIKIELDDTQHEDVPPIASPSPAEPQSIVDASDADLLMSFNLLIPARQNDEMPAAQSSPALESPRAAHAAALLWSTKRAPMPSAADATPATSTSSRSAADVEEATARNLARREAEVHPTSKWCNFCLTDKDFDDFYKGCGMGGRQSHCKACQKASTDRQRANKKPKSAAGKHQEPAEEEAEAAAETEADIEVESTATEALVEEDSMPFSLSAPERSQEAKKLNKARCDAEANPTKKYCRLCLQGQSTREHEGCPSVAYVIRI
jgi:hypothetical protein